MQMLVSLTTLIIIGMICYGVAYLINVDPHVVVSYAALAIAVDEMVRVD